MLTNVVRNVREMTWRERGEMVIALAQFFALIFLAALCGVAIIFCLAVMKTLLFG